MDLARGLAVFGMYAARVGPDPSEGVIGDGLLGELLVTGSYPALTWLPFVLAGMAVARLDLTATAVRGRLALTGAALAVLGYGGSWLALRLVPGAADAISESTWGSGVGSLWWSDTAGYPSGDDPAWLLVASPHSETTLSIVGNTGVAIAVLAACRSSLLYVPCTRPWCGGGPCCTCERSS